MFLFQRIYYSLTFVSSQFNEKKHNSLTNLYKSTNHLQHRMSWRGFWLIYITWGQNASSFKIVDKESDCDAKPAFVDKITTRDELIRQLKIRREFWNIKKDILLSCDISELISELSRPRLRYWNTYHYLFGESAADVIVYNRVDFVIT